jgi:hypothetical protein
MTDGEAIVQYIHELAQTREGRKALTFAIRYGSDPEAARRAWEWVNDPEKEL